MASRQGGAVNLHVHTGGTATPDSALTELREQLILAAAELAQLQARDEELQAHIDVISERLDVVAHKLYVATDGDYRRKVRRGVVAP
jgi:hypothetical protein